MATQTRTFVAESRRYDHAYDPVFADSRYGQPNATQRAMTRRIEQVNAAPEEVLGHSRYKFFKRPVVGFLHPVPPDVLMPGLRLVNDEDLAKTLPKLQPEEPKSNLPPHIFTQGNVTFNQRTGKAVRDIGMQSAYRDSEAQTDPWTPDYVTDPEQEDPEILSIAHLKFGQGLPATLDEVQLIQKLREKRAFEQSLPEITDQASFELRKKMLEERELQEWAQREEEMNKEQEDKLAVLVDMLKQRDEVERQQIEARIDKLRKAKAGERGQMHRTVQTARIKHHRGLVKEREAAIESHTDTKELKRDIVADHADPGSTVYAPIVREGKMPLKNQVVDYGIPLINNFQGLNALGKTLPRGTTDMKVQTPAKIVPAGFKDRKGQQVLGHLAHVDKLIQDQKQEKVVKHIENVYKKFEPVLRAPTAVVLPPADEEKERAVLLLQRLLRGRAVQNSMFVGKQKARELIKELRIDENPPADLPPDPMEAWKVAVDTAQGEVISDAVDFVSKEIVRVAEERKIAKLVALATRSRRIREAEEAGRRQAEDMLRQKQEVYYREIMSVHRATADRYLSEIFDQAVDTTVDRNASHQASVKAHVLDAMVESIENDYNDPEVVVMDLLSTFLIPEVDRRKRQSTDDIASRRYVDASHSAVLSAIGDVHSRLLTSSRPATAQ